MSMFLMPHELMPDVKKMEADLEKMTRDIAAFVPKEWATATHLMAQPIAASAAMGALGAGMASHMFGLWMGSVAASMDAAQRTTGLAFSLLDGEREIPAYNAPTSPARRLKAVVDTAAADVESAARDVAEVSLRTARDIAADVETAPWPAAPTEPPAVAAAPAEPSTVVRAEGPVKPVAMERPNAADDLKAISGVGPKLEQVLNGLGIWTYAQIAQFGEGEVAWLDDHLGFKGRIGRDDWIGQAAKLAGMQE